MGDKFSEKQEEIIHNHSLQFLKIDNFVLFSWGLHKCYWVFKLKCSVLAVYEV